MVYIYKLFKRVQEKKLLRESTAMTSQVNTRSKDYLQTLGLLSACLNTARTKMEGVVVGGFAGEGGGGERRRKRRR